MKIYEVGGCVRDRLLNRVPIDKDYVVVGATEDELLQKGLIKIGRTFPVFLDPDTKAEYALARRESKINDGYQGFETIHDPQVSLIEDLYRRDLTINAMAYDAG